MPEGKKLVDTKKPKTSATTESEKKVVKPSQVLLEWVAPERLFKRKSREFYRKIAVIIIFFSLLLLVIKEFLLIGVLGVVFFVIYVFHTIPPRNITHKITTRGINYASGYLYEWDKLNSFFIEKKENTYILNVNTVDPLMGRIFLLLSDEVDRKKLSRLLNEHISIVEDPQPTTMDRMINKITSKINL